MLHPTSDSTVADPCLVCAQPTPQQLCSDDCRAEAVHELDELTKQRRQARHWMTSWQRRDLLTRVVDPAGWWDYRKASRRLEEAVSRSQELLGAVLASSAGGPGHMEDSPPR